MSNTNDKWQQIVSAIPSPLNAHFLGSSAELSPSGLIVSLPSPTANIEQISRQIEPKYIRPKVAELFGDNIKINYQVSLPSMPEPKERIRVVDKRKRQPFFMVENSLYRDGHAARMKPGALSVYLCLVMHSDNDNRCWPSYQTIADLVGISRRSAIDKVKLLEKLEYIQKEAVFNDNGEQTSNTIYILEYPKV